MGSCQIINRKNVLLPQVTTQRDNQMRFRVQTKNPIVNNKQQNVKKTSDQPLKCLQHVANFRPAWASQPTNSSLRVASPTNGVELESPIEFVLEKEGITYFVPMLKHPSGSSILGRRSLRSKSLILEDSVSTLVLSRNRKISAS